MEEISMAQPHQWRFAGTRDTIVAREWSRGAPRFVAVLSHGYGEHIGRYQHVAEALVRHGAAVYGPDHLGHGESSGERVLIDDFEDVVTDLRTVVGRATGDHPGVPVVLIGHSMGGMIAARYAQRYGSELSALVLSGPILGRSEALGLLLTLDPMPDIPIDPGTLSRDPEVGKAYAADPLVWHGPFKRATVTAILGFLRAIASAGPIDVPTLWIHGENDRLVPLADTRTGIESIRGRDLTERIYPGAEHEIFNETDKSVVLGDVLAFLDRALA
jgi:alpha-beta hydrolase superfamily lysophospholipase